MRASSTRSCRLSACILLLLVILVSRSQESVSGAEASEDQEGKEETEQELPEEIVVPLESQRLLNASCFAIRSACNDLLFDAVHLQQVPMFRMIEVSCSDLDLGCDRAVLEAHSGRA